MNVFWCKNRSNALWFWGSFIKSLLGGSGLGLHSGAPEVTEDLRLAEGGHAGTEGDLGAHGGAGAGVGVLATPLRLLQLLCGAKTDWRL